MNKTLLLIVGLFMGGTAFGMHKALIEAASQGFRSLAVNESGVMDAMEDENRLYQEALNSVDTQLQQKYAENVLVLLKRLDSKEKQLRLEAYLQDLRKEIGAQVRGIRCTIEKEELSPQEFADQCLLLFNVHFAEKSPLLGFVRVLQDTSEPSQPYGHRLKRQRIALMPQS